MLPVPEMKEIFADWMTSIRWLHLITLKWKKGTKEQTNQDSDTLAFSLHICGIITRGTNRITEVYQVEFPFSYKESKNPVFEGRKENNFCGLYDTERQAHICFLQLGDFSYV